MNKTLTEKIDDYSRAKWSQTQFVDSGIVRRSHLPQWVWADQWVSPVTPTQAISGDSGGIYIEIVTAETVVNPANCPSADGYIVHDPALVNSALAITSAALIAGQQLRVLVAS